MPSFLKNPFIKILIGIAVLVVIFFVAAIVLGSLNSARSTSTGFAGDSIANIPMGAPGFAVNETASFRADSQTVRYGSDIVPPQPSGYVPNLEDFETTSYFLSGRLRDFETACDTFVELKADDRYHFKTLSSNLNSCNAIFFTEETYVAEALNRLEQFSGVTTNRNTESVTRHREQIQSRSSIVRQQLFSVERTLAESETAYDEMATFARAERDVSEYSNAIDTKLQKIDQLTQRKISLTSQLDNLAQQAADLEERIGVVEISANFSRSYTLNPDRSSRAWEQAWEALDETWTNFGIGLTAYFGIFLLFVLQYGLYLLVLIAVARFGWKLVRKIWSL